ncbi:MAG: hypothetical protein AAF382_03335 [Pseudomonadota bacterium]
MLAALFQRCVIVAGFGAILVSLSEFWFYEVTDDVNAALLLLGYGLLGWLFLTVVQQFHVTSLAGFIVAAALLGFLIEGVPVPVLYSELPMSILWTSLAWHGLITVGIGWYVFRRVMAHGGWAPAALYNVGLGLFLGLWNAYSWTARDTGAGGEVRFEWQHADGFIDQFLFGYALFLGGHLLFDRAYPKDVRFHRWEVLGLVTVAVAIAVLTAVGSGLIVPSLTLPVLVLGCVLALRRDRSHRQTGGVTCPDQLHQNPIPLPRFALTGLIPVCAISVYSAMVEARIGFEANVLVILTAGPASVWLLVWALRRIARGPA